MIYSRILHKARIKSGNISGSIPYLVNLRSRRQQRHHRLLSLVHRRTVQRRVALLVDHVYRDIVGQQSFDLRKVAGLLSQVQLMGHARNNM